MHSVPRAVPLVAAHRRGDRGERYQGDHRFRTRTRSQLGDVSDERMQIVRRGQPPEGAHAGLAVGASQCDQERLSAGDGLGHLQVLERSAPSWTLSTRHWMSVSSRHSALTAESPMVADISRDGDYSASMNLAGKQFRLLLSLAGEEAQRCGSTTVGPGDFLLAMLSPAFVDSRAARALARCSITRELIDELSGRARRAGKAGRRGATWNPACHEMVGFASGLAAGLGTGEVTVEDVLIAMLYQPYFEGDPTSTRHAVFAALVDLGVQVPGPPWPERREPGPRYERVDVSLEDLEALISMLPRLVPGGIAWNQDGKRGWVQPLNDVDLTAVIPFRTRGLEPRTPALPVLRQRDAEPRRAARRTPLPCVLLDRRRRPK